jgi:hypothetical protein
MKLRLFTSRQTPLPRLVSTVVAAACLLAFGSSGARASVSDYPTLYLSSATSSLLPGSYTLVTSAGPGTPSATPTAADFFDSLGLDGLWDCLNYNYVYTEVDPTGGETPPSPAVNFFFPAQWAELGNLPTGVTVRLYRQCDNSQFTRVAELPNNSSSIYDDTMSDATAAGQPVLPKAQNRIPLGTTGYQTFAPGGYADTSLDSSLDPGPYTTPNGNGWIVDGSGGVSFPTGTWTFKANVQQNGANGTAHLAVGMWKVTVSGNAITSSTMLLDPTGAGENSTNFVSGASITHAVTVNGFSLAPNEHLYVQYWRHQTAAMVSGGSASTVATMLVYDGTAQITHPAADGAPNLPTLNSPANASRANNPAPVLSASYTDPESDNGTLSFQLCSDAACSSVLQANTTSSIASGANGTWTPAALLSGTYYWRAQATDSTSNASGWSATRSFVVDLVAPGAPTLNSPAVGTRVTSPALNATFVDSDPTDSGTLDFQLCSAASCASVLQSTTSATVTGGTAVGWTPAGLVSGTTYYWRVRATDVAGNPTAWTPTPAQSFVYDTNPPAAPTLTSPANGAAVTSTPTLKATFSSNGDVGDTGTIAFRITSDGACTTVVAAGSSASALANGATGSWTPLVLALGSYYWCAQAQDAAGNTSAWSSASQFTEAAPPSPPPSSGSGGGSSSPPPTQPPPVDTTSPAPASALSPAGSAVKRKIRLRAAFPASDPGHGGTLEFQVCVDVACKTVVTNGSSGVVAPGIAATWSPTATLRDGTFFWRVRAVDLAGNASSWSIPRRLILDGTPPGRPQHFRAAIKGKTLTLRWKPPVDLRAVRGYALLVDGRRARNLKPTLRSVRIRLRPTDDRTFALASFDAAGNVSASTQPLPVRGIRQAARRYVRPSMPAR